jgi:uncharacterized protein with HEPN domain
MSPKKTKSWKMYVEDMVNSMNKIERYVLGMSYEIFEKNELVI